ncbi:MAG: signal peptidase I [Synergistetes bacterium]|nr:MAG: Signal peptidase I [bacterium 42_11]MBC7331269.1 signal peptidase I [Synergistota bacterium]MDK2871569.1 signal peptidase [bacterium]
MKELKKKSAWREIIETILVAVVLALLIRTFVVEAFYIPSSSMVPTLEPGDRILVLKFYYYFTDPKRGDIVVFRFPLDPSKDLIKRIVAVGGDVVKISNGHLYVNGKEVNEPYVVNRDFYNMPSVTVPKGFFFVLGDNRPNSEDSRYWGFLPRENIKGKAVVRYWPPSRIGLIR